VFTQEVELPDGNSGAGAIERESVNLDVQLTSLSFEQIILLIVAKVQYWEEVSEIHEKVVSIASQLVLNFPRRGAIFPSWFANFDRADMGYQPTLEFLKGDESLQAMSMSRPHGVGEAIPYQWVERSERCYFMTSDGTENVRWGLNGFQKVNLLNAPHSSYQTEGNEIWLCAGTPRPDIRTVATHAGEMPILVKSGEGERDDFTVVVKLEPSGTRFLDVHAHKSAKLLYQFQGQVPGRRWAFDFKSEEQVTLPEEPIELELTDQVRYDITHGKVTLADVAKLDFANKVADDEGITDVIARKRFIGEGLRWLSSLINRGTSIIEVFHEGLRDNVARVREEFRIRAYEGIDVETEAERGNIQYSALHKPRTRFTVRGIPPIDLTDDEIARRSEADLKTLARVRDLTEEEITDYTGGSFPCAAASVRMILRRFGISANFGYQSRGNFEPITEEKKIGDKVITDDAARALISLGYPLALQTLPDDCSWGIVYTTNLIKVPSRYLYSVAKNEDETKSFGYVLSSEVYNFACGALGISPRDNYIQERRGYLLMLVNNQGESGKKVHAMLYANKDKVYGPKEKIRFPSGVPVTGTEFVQGGVINGVPVAKGIVKEVSVTVNGVSSLTCQSYGFLDTSGTPASYSTHIGWDIAKLGPDSAVFTEMYHEREVGWFPELTFGSCPPGVSAGCDLVIIAGVGTMKRPDWITGVSFRQREIPANWDHCLCYYMSVGSPPIFAYFREPVKDMLQGLRYLWMYTTILSQIVIAQRSVQKNADYIRADVANVNKDVEVYGKRDVLHAILRKASQMVVRAVPDENMKYAEASLHLGRKMAVLIQSIALSRKPYNFSIKELLELTVSLPLTRLPGTSNDVIADFPPLT
jgi:hypothetical protein